MKWGVELYDDVHGFRERQVIGTDTLEANLEHHLAGTTHKPIFQVLLEVCKAYDSLDRGLCLEILRRYGLGPNLTCILTNYWERHRFVPNFGKFFRKDLGQGGG